MEVTYQAISDIIAEIYNNKPKITETFIGFGIKSGRYKAEIIIALKEDKPITEDEDVPQSLEIYVWFSHNEEGSLRLSKRSGRQICKLRDSFKLGLEWSELVTVRVSKKKVAVGLYRKVDIDIEDIRMAHEGNSRSALVRTLHHLVDEWEMLNPILYGYVTKQIKKSAHAKHLLAEPGGSC